MKKNGIATSVIGLIIVAIIIVAGASAYILMSPGEVEKEIKTATIGVLADFTGVTSIYGLPNSKGVTFAIEKINELYPEGVPIGEEMYKFELVLEDYGGKPEEVPLAARRLIDAGVFAIISMAGYDLTPVLSELESAEIPALVWLDPSPYCPIENPWVYRYMYSVESLIGGVSYYVYDVLGANTVAIMHSTLTVEAGMCDVFQAYAETYGEVVYRTQYEMGETVFQPYLAQAMEAGADCISSVSTVYCMSQYIQAKEIGYDGYFAGITGMNETQAETLGGPDYAIYLSKVYQGEAVDPFIHPDKSIREWGVSFLERFGETASDVVCWGYDLALVIVSAAMEAGTVENRQTFTETLAELPYEFELQDHITSMVYPLRVNKLWNEDGNVKMTTVVAGWTEEGCKIPIVEIKEEGGEIISATPFPQELIDELIAEFLERHS